MPRFKDDQQVYAQLGGMFEDALADDAAGGRMRAIGGTVQWQLRRPTARITVKLGEEQTPGVDFGDTDVKPEVVLSMDADTAHRFWAGELPMHVALSRGLIRAKGPVATILRIVPAVGPAKDLYAARVAGGGVVAEVEAPVAEGEAPVVDAESEAPVVDEAVGEAEPEAPAAEVEAPAADAEPEAPVVDEAVGEAGPEAPAAEVEAPAADAEAEAPVVDEAVGEAEPEAPAAESEAPAADAEPEAPAEDAPAS